MLRVQRTLTWVLSTFVLAMGPALVLGPGLPSMGLSSKALAQDSGADLAAPPSPPSSAPPSSASAQEGETSADGLQVPQGYVPTDQTPTYEAPTEATPNAADEAFASPYTAPMYPAPDMKLLALSRMPMPAPVQTPPPANTFTANPLLLLIGVVGFQYERALNKYVSLFGGPNLVLFDGLAQVEGEYHRYGVDLGARFFFTGHAPEGFWLGPQLEAFLVSVENSLGESGSGLGWAAGGLGGYTWVLGDIVVLSLGLGFQYMDVSTDVEGDRVARAGFGMVGRASVGFAF